MIFGDVITYLRPDCDWECVGDTSEYRNYRSINGVEMPSIDDCLRVWDDVKLVIYLDSIRSQRNDALAASDWTQVADAPVNTKAWAAYRQALRDIPAKVKDPTQPVDWPTPPE